MRIPRIYLPLPLTVGATVQLDDNAFGHAVRVLRLKPGADLVLFDGRSHAYAAILKEVGKRDAWVEIRADLPVQAEPPLRIVLAQGISRGDKMDYTVQKAVELGVNAIQPLFTERGGVDLTGERLLRKVQHWQGIIIGACEQCGQNRLPELYQPLPLMAWLEQLTVAELRLLLDPTARCGLREISASVDQITLLIGPEGGLSVAEIAKALATGFVGVRLGQRVLRTETAGLAALSAVQTLWGDWH